MVLAGLLWPLTNLVQTLPYLIGVIWILLAAFYDVSFVLQQSMFLCVYFYLTNVLERFLCFYLNVESAILNTFINSATLAVLFASMLGFSPLSQSSSSVTSFAVLIYSITLQLLEPILMFIEMVQIIRFIFNMGDKLRNRIYEDEASTPIFKVFTILATLINFGLSLFATIYICRQESSLFAVLSIIVLCANITFTTVSISYEHIIIDPSCMAIYTSYLLCLATIESHVVSFDVSTNVSIAETETGDYLFTLLNRLELTVDALKKGFFSIAIQLSPLFWVAFILRIKCLTSFLEGQLCKTFLLEEEDAFEELEEGEGSWSNYICKVASYLTPSRSALVRISIVVGFTSIILQRFSTGTLFVLARYQWILRVGQTFAAAIFYIFALKAFESSQEDIGTHYSY